MKPYIPAALSLISLVATSCSGCAETEHTENITAEITAAQMEGRNAARIFINQEWEDTTLLKKHIREARARKNKYVITGNYRCADAFDSTFVSTIRAVRPDIADMAERE